jgi:hypothetical protein
VKDVGRTPERLVGVALLGAVAWSFPLLALFGGPRTVLGIPLLLVYLFAVWGLLIGLTALSLRRPSRGAPPRA